MEEIGLAHVLELQQQLEEAQSQIVSTRVVMDALRGKFKAMRGEVASTNKKVEEQAIKIRALEATIAQLRELNDRYAEKYNAICVRWQCDRQESVENARQMTEVLSAARKHEYLLTRMCNVLVNDWLTDEQRQMLLSKNHDYEEIRQLTLARRSGRDLPTILSSSGPQSRHPKQQTCESEDLT
jgi:chromosome segregation ATPase